MESLACEIRLLCDVTLRDMFIQHGYPDFSVGDIVIVARWSTQRELYSRWLDSVLGIVKRY